MQNLTQEELQLRLAGAILEWNEGEIFPLSDLTELLAAGADPLTLSPNILNTALDNSDISNFILRKLPAAKKIGWMQRAQARSRERVEQNNPIAAQQEPDEPECPNAQLPAGTPNYCFSALSMTENGIVDAAGEYQKCASILLLIPSGGAGEDELVCTSAEALEAGMADSDRVRYECTSNFAFTVNDPDVRIPIATAQASGVVFDLPQDSFDLSRPYVPVSIGIETLVDPETQQQKVFPRNGYLPESDVQRLVAVAREAIELKAEAVEAQKEVARDADPIVNRLFTLVHKGTIPFTISRKLAVGGRSVVADDYLGASHCQYGSTIEVYTVREFLVEPDGRQTSLEEEEDSPLIETVVEDDVNQVRALLNNYTGNLNARDFQGMTALMISVVESYNAEIVRLLIEAGADLNLRDARGETALMLAASGDNIEMVHALIEAGADPNLRDTGREMTALMFAARDGSTEIVQALIEAGADLNLQDTGRKMTALMFAARHGNIGAQQALIEAGADLNLQDGNGQGLRSDGNSALMIAAYLGRKETVLELIRAGAALDLQNSEGLTAVQIAEAGGHLEIVSILEEADAKNSAMMGADEVKRSSMNGGQEPYFPVLQRGGFVPQEPYFVLEGGGSVPQEPYFPVLEGAGSVPQEPNFSVLQEKCLTGLLQHKDAALTRITQLMQSKKDRDALAQGLEFSRLNPEHYAEWQMGPVTEREQVGRPLDNNILACCYLIGIDAGPFRGIHLHELTLYYKTSPDGPQRTIPALIFQNGSELTGYIKSKWQALFYGDLSTDGDSWKGFWPEDSELLKSLGGGEFATQEMIMAPGASRGPEEAQQWKDFYNDMVFSLALQVLQTNVQTSVPEVAPVPRPPEPTPYEEIKDMLDDKNSFTTQPKTNITVEDLLKEKRLTYAELNGGKYNIKMRQARRIAKLLGELDQKGSAISQESKSPSRDIGAGTNTAKGSTMMGAGEDSLWPLQSQEVANPRVREFMQGTYDAAGCKKFILALTPGQIGSIPWKDINSEFRPPCWDVRKSLLWGWVDKNPLVCRQRYKGDLIPVSGCVEYYNKCRWYSRIEKLLQRDDLYQFLEGKPVSRALRGARRGRRWESYIDPLDTRWKYTYARQCKEIVLAAVQQNGQAFNYASDTLKADREVVLAAVKQDGQALESASEALRADRDVVMAAVQQNGQALNYASAEIQADREVVMAAVKQDGWALQYASEALRADRDVVMGAVQQEGWALQFASEELQADREVAMAAVQQDGRSLEFASDELQADREVVMAAVQQEGYALRYASEALRADREVAMAAVQQEGWALQFASEELQADREVAMAAVQQDGRALQFASEELQADREVVMAAVKQDGRALEFASEELRADREVVMAAVKQDGRALEFASEELQEDREVVLAMNSGWIG